MLSFVVFAKEPVPGQVKTRLSPPLEPAEAAALYSAFVRDVCSVVSSIAAPGDRRVLASPGGPGANLAEIADGEGFETAEQVGEDLGARMKRAIALELARGVDAVVLVGSDSPTMPASALRDAADRLRRNPAGRPLALLGPACDGGYWLVGAAAEVPELFDGIPWSTREVLATTLDRAVRGRVDVELLPFWYDADEPQDLRFLDAHLRWMAARGAPVAPHTTRALSALREAGRGIFLS